MPNKLFTLIKFFLSLAIAFSAAAGAVFFLHGFSFVILVCATGVFFLAAGAAALNQYQEREPDALMERTRHRPIPAGTITPEHALITALCFAVAGTAILWLGSGWLPALLGLLNLAWYNGIYTPLKRRSHFAVFAGAVNGAVPPLIGWVSAGGALADPKILFLAFFIYIWQIPHFWLLLMMYGEEYKKAGFKPVTGQITPTMQPLILLVWICATAVSTLFLPYFGLIHSRVIVWLVLSSALLMLALGVIQVMGKASRLRHRRAFIGFNIFMLTTFLLVILDQVI